METPTPRDSPVRRQRAPQAPRFDGCSLLLGIAWIVLGAVLIWSAWKAAGPASVELGSAGSVIGIGGGGPRHFGWGHALRLLAGVVVVFIGLCGLAVGMGWVKVPATVSDGVEGDVADREDESIAPEPDAPGDAESPAPEGHDEAPRARLARDGLRFTCPNCGATTTGSTRISPRGDALCEHCDGWYSLPQDH